MTATSSTLPNLQRGRTLADMQPQGWDKTKRPINFMTPSLWATDHSFLNRTEVALWEVDTDDRRQTITPCTERSLSHGSDGTLVEENDH